MHIVFVMANNSSVPYFNWFAERAAQSPEVTFSFVCLYPSKPKMIEDVKAFGCDCYWIPFDNQKRKSSFIKCLWPLYKLFRKLKPHAVHTHLFDDSLPALLAARLAGVKQRVITKGDTTYHYFYAPKWVPFDKFNNWNATDIIAISDESKKFILEKEQAAPNKVTRIHHGIPIKHFTSYSEEDQNFLLDKFGLRGKILIGTVARLIAWKGHRQILEAAEIFVKKHPEAIFLFVGVGPEEEELKQIVKNKGLEGHVVFTGWVERKLIPSLYSLMDMYLHAANYEPFGFVIAEAMVNGVPIVSTPTGAALDSIEHQKNGYLAEADNAKDLAKGLEFIFSHFQGADRAHIKESGTHLFSFEVMWQNYIHLYGDEKSALSPNRELKKIH